MDISATGRRSPAWLGSAACGLMAAELQLQRGPSGEHLARIAARRALVSLKQTFMRAAVELTGTDADWLRRKVRQADDSTELWRLRPTILAMLPDEGGCAALHRAELNLQLDSIFPESAASDSVPPVGGLAAIPPQLRPR